MLKTWIWNNSILDLVLLSMRIIINACTIYKKCPIFNFFKYTSSSLKTKSQIINLYFILTNNGWRKWKWTIVNDFLLLKCGVEIYYYIHLPYITEPYDYRMRFSRIIVSNSVEREVQYYFTRTSCQIQFSFLCNKNFFIDFMSSFGFLNILGKHLFSNSQVYIFHMANY